jgi:hypothetical protein
MGRGMGDVVELFAELGREGLCGFRRVKGGAKLTKCLTSTIFVSVSPQHGIPLLYVANRGYSSYMLSTMTNSFLLSLLC